MSRCLYKFYWDCGRMGAVEGLFVESPSTIQQSIGKKVYFGEILGKHSEIHGSLSEEDFKVISEDKNVVSVFEEHVGTFGYNPFYYLVEEGA